MTVCYFLSVKSDLITVATFYSVVVTDRRSKRRSSLLSNHTVNIPTIFADLPAAGVDLELLDVNKMCMEVDFCLQ